MAINAEDVKLMRPERVTDEPDGGGQMTGVEIVSGDINNLFDDISRVNLAVGNTSVRKIYGAVRSANTDIFLGAHMCLIKDAAAENVSTMLFNTSSHYDERAAAKDSIERYRVRATRSNMRPVGTQRDGQTAVVFYSQDETDLPEVGDTLAMINEGAGLEQYIKVREVNVRDTSYTYTVNTSNGPVYQTFDALEITLGITQPLNYQFDAAEPSPGGIPATVIYKTQASASANYYGIRPIAQPATEGAMSVYVDTIFQPLVPVATSETALLDQTPGAFTKAAKAAGPDMSISMGTIGTGAVTLTLPLAFVPGSLRLTIAGSVYGDRGTTLTLISGSPRISEGAIISATEGTVALNLTLSSAVSATFTPAGSVEVVPYTAATPITDANRQLTYTGVLAPLPDPGTLTFEFMYQGAWYSISDTGTGELSGTGGGSGVLNLNTGSYSVTLPAEPDAGSTLITTWAQSPFLADNGPGGADAFIKVTLPDAPVNGSVQLSWNVGGVGLIATEQSDGTLSGNATGYIEGNNIFFKPTGSLPTGNISVTYSARDTSRQTYSAAISERTGGSLTITTGATNIRPASVEFSLGCSVEVDNLLNGERFTTRMAVDIELSGRADGTLYGKLNGQVINVGSIDAAAGTITINADSMVVSAPDFVMTRPATFGSPQTGVLVMSAKTLRIESQSTDVGYFSDDSGAPATYAPNLTDIDIAVRAICSSYPVPGSVAFSIGNVIFYDGGDGYLYREWSALTGTGLQCGQIGYRSASINVNYGQVYQSIGNLTLTTLSVCSGIGAAVAVNAVTFHTAATPLRTGGLQLMARRSTDTALVIAESDSEGVISGDFDTGNRIGELPQPTSSGGYSLPVVPQTDSAGGCVGTIDYETGVIQIEFDSPVILTTLTYNAVAFTTVPLPADILGLDPVKLPTNGRVQVIKPGYLTVIHNTQYITEPSPIAGMQIDCGRTNLAKIKISGADGAELAGDQFLIDKISGVITLSDPFSAVDESGNSLTMPLTIEHRVEDMATVSSAEIGGRLSITTPLTHDYPVDGSYVSAAVMFGDLQARLTNLFFQQIDIAGVFEDEVAGNVSNASYDDLNFPIAVDNLGSIEERWKIHFTSATAFQLIGENVGVIETGNINSDFSPINPASGTPYFTVLSGGWGSGWIASNVVRFNTSAAAAPAWITRTVLQSSNSQEDDSITVEFRGDAD